MIPATAGLAALMISLGVLVKCMSSIGPSATGAILPMLKVAAVITVIVAAVIVIAGAIKALGGDKAVRFIQGAADILKRVGEAIGSLYGGFIGIDSAGLRYGNVHGAHKEH